LIPVRSDFTGRTGLSTLENRIKRFSLPEVDVFSTTVE